MPASESLQPPRYLGGPDHCGVKITLSFDISLVEITLDFSIKSVKITLDSGRMVSAMHRNALNDLVEWKDKPLRKPLVIRGARQVGKSHLVRMFAAAHFDNLVEVNFETASNLADLFTSNDPRLTVDRLELQFNTTITPGKTLVFLDEIQAAPAVFVALRYFYEQMPELHLVAAGSLLEFAPGSQGFAVPVGRIEYLHLGPMQFDEFLLAVGEQRLAAFLDEWIPGRDLPDSIHQRLTDLFRRFIAVGGMPGVVAAHVQAGTHRQVEEVKHSILATYQDDFGKYGARVNHRNVRTVFGAIPAQVGNRLKYANIERDTRSAELSAALDLLCRARVCTKVRRTPANGVPLAYQADDTNFKALFLDVGLMNTRLGLSMLDFMRSSDLMAVNQGAICEQVVGQHLLYSAPSCQEPELYFWSRDKASSAAEVDYVIAVGPRVVPVEVKAGATGRLKSLHMFLREKKANFAVRLNSDLPSLLEARTSIADGDNTTFRLLSLPLYMVTQVRRLIGLVKGS